MSLSTFEKEAPLLARTAAGLRCALRDGRLGHTLLFYGPTGAGKQAVAEALAAAYMCPRGKAGDGCGACPTCRRVAAGVHPDLHLLGPEDGKRDIAVAAVRGLIEELAMAPLEARGRVAILGPADALGDEGANALLKTLEEPPNGALVILWTARPDLILPTIRSRCQEIRFARRSPTAAPAPADEGAVAGPTHGDLCREAAEALRASRPGDPLDRADAAFAAIERAAEADESGATPTEKLRRAILAMIDLLTELARGGLQDAVAHGAGIGPLERAVARLGEAATAIESNAVPRLCLEVLALDLHDVGSSLHDAR